MAFSKRFSVIGCCIRLHNFCVGAKIEVQGELMKHDGKVKFVTVVSMDPPTLHRLWSPVENTTECRCENCSRTGRAQKKSDTSNLCTLKRLLRDGRFVRPYLGAGEDERNCF